MAGKELWGAIERQDALFELLLNFTLVMYLSIQTGYSFCWLVVLAGSNKHVVGSTCVNG
jgi:hypothetical protein